MSRSKILKSSGLAALAAGVAIIALPGAAQAQRWGHDGQGGGWRGGDAAAAQQANGGGWHGRGDGGERTQPAPQAAPQPAPQPAPRVVQQAPVQQAPVQQRWNQEGRGAWQGGNRNWQAGQNAGAWRGGGQSVPQVQAQQRDWRGRGWNGSGQPQVRTDRSWTGNRDAYRGDNRGNWNGNRTWSGNGYRQGYAQGGGNWNRDWRHDNRYDWQNYRNYHRDIYRLGRYDAPYRGYSYRRLGVGVYLDSLFFGSDYLIDDPFYYRLPEVYGPYRWIRYYDDAVLVDVYSGEVEDVIYGFFY